VPLPRRILGLSVCFIALPQLAHSTYRFSSRALRKRDAPCEQSVRRYHRVDSAPAAKIFSPTVLTRL
jgi:hypothetical protein